MRRYTFFASLCGLTLGLALLTAVHAHPGPAGPVGVQVRGGQRPAPEGLWEDKVTVGDVKLTRSLEIKKAAGGGWTGTLDIPEQGVKGVPGDAVTFQDGRLDLTIKAIMAHFSGTMDASGEKIAGTLKQQTLNLATSVVLYARLMRSIPEVGLRREYRKRFWRLVKARPDPNVAVLYLLKCCLHYHQYTMARQMKSAGSRVVNSF